LRVRRIKPDQPAALLVRAAFQAAVSRIRTADPEARHGEPEGVHHLRTATRRLRSELRAMRSLVEADWRKGIEVELKWLAGLLGGVRDLDILARRLRNNEAPRTQHTADDRSAVPDEPGGQLDSLFESLRARHRCNSQRLRKALQGDRYRRLITSLEASREQPALTSRAAKPCRKVLPSLAVETWKKLRKDARKLDRSDPDTAFHEVRKLAKRARYTAELIAPALGPDSPEQAERFIKLATQLQDVLGEHQDAIVACAELERFLAEEVSDPASKCQVRTMIRQQHGCSDRSRDGFFEIWDKLDRKKSLRWMRPRAGSHA
jgi:CHAD domain-containing protein